MSLIKARGVPISVCTFEHFSEDDVECSICGYLVLDRVDDEFEEDNKLINKKYGYHRLAKLYNTRNKKDVCSHVSHTLCLHKWIMTSKKMTCPVCRAGCQLEVNLRQLIDRVEIVRKYRKNGILLKRYEKNGVNKIGEYRSYYRNGKIREKRFYNNKGKLHGEYLLQWKNGMKCVEAHFKHNKPHNAFKEYYRNGKLRGLFHYKNGNLHGRVKKMDENGCIERLESYYMDNKNGLKEKFVNGVCVYRVRYKFDMKDGLKKEWYPSGRLKMECFYIEGVLCGVYKQYYDDGTLRISTNYDDGKISGYYYEYYSTGLIKYAVDLKMCGSDIESCVRYLYNGTDNKKYMLCDTLFKDLPPYIKFQIDYYLPNFCKKCWNHLIIDDVFIEGNLAVLTTVCCKCVKTQNKPGFCNSCETTNATAFNYCGDCECYGCDCGTSIDRISAFCYICENCEKCGNYVYGKVCNECGLDEKACSCDEGINYPVCMTCYYDRLRNIYHPVKLEII